MPSVGSTPTTSPATSTLNASQNDHQSNNNSSVYTHCNHQYQNHSTSLVNSATPILNSATVLNDHANNSSSTTTSSISTPIHSPDLQLSSTVSIDNNLQAIIPIINRYSASSQVNTVATTTTTVSTFITSPKNSLSPLSCVNQFNYNSALSKNPFYSSNSTHHQLPDSTKFLIITPAVSIDRDFDNDTGAPANEECTETFNYSSINTTTNSEFNSINNNTIEMANITASNLSFKSVNNSYKEQYFHHYHQNRHNYLSNNFRSKYNSIYNQQQMNQHQQKSQYNFLSKSANTLSDFTAATTPSSWRWCSLICAAMRCFGGGRNNNARSHYTSTFSARNYTQVKDDSASFGSGSRLSNPFSCIGGGISDSNDSSISSGIKFNRNLKTSCQNNSKTMITGPFTTPRKTRDHMNNICYEL